METEHEMLKQRRVFTEPIKLDGVTLIAAMAVRVGSDPRGYGGTVRPAGIYFVRGDNVTWRPAVDVNRIVLGAQIVAITALITRAVLGFLSRRRRFRW
jgi:hypothetical protein